MKHVLVHGASIGELLAAETVVADLRHAVPDLSVTYSYTSPSVPKWPSWPANTIERLPAPLPGVMDRWLDRLRPDLLVLSRGDVWPAMLRAAHRRRIPVAVSGGRIASGSRRLRWPWRPVYARALQPVAYVGAVSEEDAERWIALGVRAERVQVTGDPAVDRVLAYRPNTEIVAALRAWAGDEPLLVVGSMQPSDRKAVLALLAAAPRAVVVPHDPEWDPRLPGTAPWTPGQAPPDVPHLVARQRGVLMDCYAAARAAYVGGGYRGRVHALDEPAAAGVPVLRGPDSAASLSATWEAWRTDPRLAQHAGQQSSARLQARAGATDLVVSSISGTLMSY